MTTYDSEHGVVPQRAGVGSRPPRPPWLARVRDRADGRFVILVIVAAIVAYLALVPVVTMIVASLKSNFLGTGADPWTLSNYANTFDSSGFGTLVANSFEYAAATAAVSTIIGFGLSWLVARTNTPAKGFAQLAAIIPLIVPGILNTVSWGLLLSPKTGPINIALRAVGLGTFDIYSLPGMVFVQAIHVTPVAFLMGVATFSSMDPSLEEASLASGASPRRTFRRITLKLARPAIVAAFLLMFIQTISSFEVPQLLGVPGHTFVFVSEIYTALQQYPANYGTIGVIGVFVLVLAVVGVVYAQRTQRRAAATITGKNFRTQVTDIGRWRWAGLAAFVLFFLIAVGLPVLMLIWSALLPVYQTPSLAAAEHLTLGNFSQILNTPSLVSSLVHSIVLSVIAGAVVTLLCAVLAYITVKTKIRGRVVLDAVATVPIAVPSIILGVGILFWYLVTPLPIHLYGTFAILVLAFITIGLPYGLRYMAPGMARISDELEEAATASGAGFMRTFRRIYLPLLGPSLMAAFLYTMVVAFREVSAAIFLYSQNTQVVSVEVFNLWSDGSYPVVAALGIVMLLVLLVLVIAVRVLGRRFGLSSDTLLRGGH